MALRGNYEISWDAQCGLCAVQYCAPQQSSRRPLRKEGRGYYCSCSDKGKEGV